MGKQNIDPVIQNKIQELITLVSEQKKEISRLKKRTSTAKPDENDVVKFVRIFQEFITESSNNNWQFERTYRTKAAQDFIDVDFSKYREFIDTRIGKENHDEFKSFLIDMRLVEPETFTRRTGIIVGSPNERKKVVRIRQEVYKRLTDNLAV